MISWEGYALSLCEFEVLVTDKSHKRYGQRGRITAHHGCRGKGSYDIKFVDDEGIEVEEEFSGKYGDDPQGTKMFYRYDNDLGAIFDKEGRGPNSLARELLR